MVKKAQLKVFAIITCILLAIFIAVLGSVNIIMQAVMQRQSKDVLKKIAAGVEYNDSTHQFMISRPENFGQKPAREEPPPSEPPSKPTTQAALPPSSEVSTDASEEETTDTTETSTEAAVTAASVEISVVSVVSSSEASVATSELGGSVVCAAGWLGGSDGGGSSRAGF